MAVNSALKSSFAHPDCVRSSRHAHFEHTVSDSTERATSIPTTSRLTKKDGSSGETAIHQKVNSPLNSHIRRDPSGCKSPRQTKKEDGHLTGLDHIQRPKSEVQYHRAALLYKQLGLR